MYLTMTRKADGIRTTDGVDMHRYRVTLTDVNGATLTFPFFTGMGWDTDPHIGHVLYSLATEMSVDDDDDDLQMTRRQWEEVKAHNDRVRSFFGSWADTLQEVASMLEAVEGMSVDLDALSTAVGRASDKGDADGTAAAGWFLQEIIGGHASGDERAAAASIVRGIDDGDPMVLDTFPTLDLSGQWADGPSSRSVLEALDLEALDPDSEVAQEVVDAYRDAFDAAVSVEVERACRARLSD